MKNKEVTVKNYKSEKEAEEILREKIKSISFDYLVFYVQNTQEDEDDEELIGVQSEEDVINEEFNFNIHRILMTGEDCKVVKAGDKVVLNPAAQMNTIPMVISDIMFFLVPERSHISILN
jgi:hypothetical protein